MPSCTVSMSGVPVARPEPTAVIVDGSSVFAGAAPAGAASAVPDEPVHADAVSTTASARTAKATGADNWTRDLGMGSLLDQGCDHWTSARGPRFPPRNVVGVRLPLMPPVRPMLAKAIDGFDALPAGDMLFEPKWDGFRCIVFRDGDEIELG